MMRNTRLRAWLACATLTFLLAACQLLTPPTPTTPTEAVGVTYASITAIADATGARLQAGAITATQAGEILAILEHADAIADASKLALSDGRPEDAAVYLAIATTILNDLEARLRQ